MDGKPRETNPDDVPKEFLCPITMLIMSDPVQDSCYPPHTFEKEAIFVYLNSYSKCPLKGIWKNTEMKEDKLLKKKIDQWLKDHPHKDDRCKTVPKEWKKHVEEVQKYGTANAAHLLILGSDEEQDNESKQDSSFSESDWETDFSVFSS